MILRPKALKISGYSGFLPVLNTRGFLMLTPEGVDESPQPGTPSQ